MLGVHWRVWQRGHEEPAAADVHVDTLPGRAGVAESRVACLLVAAEGSRKARSNDVCLTLEEGPLAGLEDTGFGTKMMVKGWNDQPVSRPVQTSLFFFISYPSLRQPL